MRTMTNPEEFFSIHKDNRTFLEATTNFQMRVFISSYGFRAPRELAEILINRRDK